MIRTVGILCKPRKEDLCSVLPPLVEWLRARKLNVLLDQSAAESCSSLDKASARERLASEADLLVVMGGMGLCWRRRACWVTAKFQFWA